MKRWLVKMVYNRNSKGIAAGIAGAIASRVAATGLDVPPDVVAWLGEAVLFGMATGFAAWLQPNEGE